MNAVRTISDIEFLRRGDTREKAHFYIYRAGSALLRRDVRAKVEGAAAAHGRMLIGVPIGVNRAGRSAPSLYDGLSTSSILGIGLISCDVDTEKLKSDDLEMVLTGLANHQFSHHLFLSVPHNHAVLQTPAWRAAVEKVSLIEEQVVNTASYKTIARNYLENGRLGDLGHLSQSQRFMRMLKKFVKEKERTPFALSMQIDSIVLSEMEHGQFRDSEKKPEARKAHLPLPERLRKFLDYHDADSFAGVMEVVDRQRHQMMLEPTEILARIFRATAGTLENNDKRYSRPQNDLHLRWAALLLANEESVLSGNVFVAMEQLCQEYYRAAKNSKWFAAENEWPSIACLMDVRAVDEPTRLDNARIELQAALRKRVDRLDDAGLSWFRAAALSDERAWATEVSMVGASDVVVRQN